MAKIFKKTIGKLDNVYEYICTYISENGYAPSIRNICDGMHITSPSLVKYYLDMLESEGKILRGDNSRRIITLPQQQLSTKEMPSQAFSSYFCPVLGQVTAGVPILATQNISEYYPLPDNEFPRESTFMLKVIGDSMINAGINSGDIVIVNSQKSAKNSDIIVAMWDDCATVKRFFNKNKCIVLHPENEAYNDIIISSNQSFEILGVVVGLIRKF